MAVDYSSYASTSDLRKAGDAIPNRNVYTALAKGAITGYSNYLDSRRQQASLRFQSSISSNDAVIARMNADFAKKQAKRQASSHINDMYLVFRQAEHQAMLQGVADAQAIHKQNAVNASSGVRMDGGSKKEIIQTEKLSAKINQTSIQENAIVTASNMKLQAINAETTGILESANYMAQAYIAEGDAKASEIMANSISPVTSGLVGFISSFGSSFMASKMGK